MGRHRQDRCARDHDLTIPGAVEVCERISTTGKPYTSRYCKLCKGEASTRWYMTLAARRKEAREKKAAAKPPEPPKPERVPKKQPTRHYLQKEPKRPMQDDIHALAKAIIERKDILKHSVVSVEQLVRQLKFDKRRA